MSDLAHTLSLNALRRQLELKKRIEETEPVSISDLVGIDPYWTSERLEHYVKFLICLTVNEQQKLYKEFHPNTSHWIFHAKIEECPVEAAIPLLKEFISKFDNGFDQIFSFVGLALECGTDDGSLYKRMALKKIKDKIKKCTNDLLLDSEIMEEENKFKELLSDLTDWRNEDFHVDPSDNNANIKLMQIGSRLNPVLNEMVLYCDGIMKTKGMLKLFKEAPVDEMYKKKSYYPALNGIVYRGTIVGLKIIINEGWKFFWLDMAMLKKIKFDEINLDLAIKYKNIPAIHHCMRHQCKGVPTDKQYNEIYTIITERGPKYGYVNEIKEINDILNKKD